MRLKAKGLRKEISSSLVGKLNGKNIQATIDEGAELNALDYNTACQTNAQFVPTGCKATAAGSKELKIIGQTK